MLAGVNLLGGFIFGYNTGVIAGAQDLISATGKHWYLDATMQGVVTASILIGALVGSIIGGPISDHFGRKVGIIVLAAISMVFAPVLAISPNLNALIISRAILGLGVGMSGIICPVYVAENSPPERRGVLGVLFQLAITIGICIAYIINLALEDVHHNWRIMFGLGAIPAFLLLILAFVIPESFVWQAQRTGGGERSALLPTNDPGSTLSERIVLFTKSRALYIGIVLAVAQQLTGINAFMFYAQKIFLGAGLKNPNFPTIGLGAWNVLVTLCAIPAVSRFGRRPLLIVGTMIMGVACIALGLVWEFADGQTKGIIAIILLLLFVFAFEFGDGPLFWMVAHELFTPEIKTVGQSTLNAAQWIFNIILCFFFPIAVDNLGTPPVFYFFGALGVICTTLLFFFLPETRPTKTTN